MKLVSATVRNYRVHSDKTVDFDPRLTLITGPNESGKSTLVEAIHRGLFLRFKTGGEVQKGMVSSRVGGHPEVEIRFEAEEKSATIKKGFKGQTGSCSLNIAGQPALTGDAAEDALAALLKVGEAARGSGVDQRWAHLWVWQGTSGRDPAATVAEQQDDLIRRLQEHGGALILSNLDQQIASDIREKENELFTNGGDARANTAWHRALQEVERLEEQHDSRLAKVNELAEAADLYRKAIATLEEKRRDLNGTQAELEKWKEKSERAESLARELAPLQRDLDDCERGITELEKVAAGLVTAREEKEDAAKELAYGRNAIAQLREKAEAAAAEVRTAAENVSAARRAFDEARKKAGALAHHVTALEKKAQLEKLQEEGAHIEARQKDLAGIQAQLDKLPAVRPEDLDELEGLKEDMDAAAARLSALGARIKIVRAGEAIKIDGRKIAEGEAEVITSAAIIQVGDKTELQVSPGRHEDLDSAREEAEESRKSFADALIAKGLKDIAAARSALTTREHLEDKKSSVEKELKRLKPADHKRNIDEVTREHLEAERVAGVAAKEAGLELPAKLADAKSARKEADAGLKKIEHEAAAAENRKDALEKIRQTADEDYQARQDTIVDIEKRLAGAESQINAIEALHGSGEVRAGRLLKLKGQRDTVAASMQNIKKQIAELQPELIKSTIERLERAAKVLQGAIDHADRERIGNEVRLKQNGSSDPHAELAQAASDLENARVHCASLERQARAIKLLAELSGSIQKESAARLTQPLEEAASHYLQCMFGRDATVRLKWIAETRKFEGLEVSREGAGLSTFAFEALSGGAREQVGVALRLAMAEVLAAGHGGQLPVVLDDAFANSDPDRVKALQSMLDLAANRGLQIIVLTCNPSDYSTLGAREINLAGR